MAGCTLDSSHHFSMNIIINPHFSAKRGIIEAALKGTLTPVRTFCNQRNTVELVNLNDDSSESASQAVLKTFKKLNLWRSIVYTLFRKSKARRAYENALRLTEAGFNTPTPLGYAEFYKHGIIRYTTLLTAFSENPSVEIISHSDFSPLQNNQLIYDLAKFIGNLHKNGIQPLDLNPSNVLYALGKNGRYNFELIDINRMRFTATPSAKKSMKACYLLGINVYIASYFLPVYAYVRNFDADRCSYLLSRIRYRKDRLSQLKSHLFGKKKHG